MALMCGTPAAQQRLWSLRERYRERCYLLSPNRRAMLGLKRIGVGALSAAWFFGSTILAPVYFSFVAGFLASVFAPSFAFVATVGTFIAGVVVGAKTTSYVHGSMLRRLFRRALEEIDRSMQTQASIGGTTSAGAPVLLPPRRGPLR